MSNIISKIYERGVYEEFAKFSVERFRRNLRAIDGKMPKKSKSKKLSASELYAGLKYRLVFDSNRQVSKIVFEYPKQGLFVDMGVGRGVSLSDIGYQKIGRTLLGRKVGERRAKRWWLKTIYGRTITLMNIVAQQRGDEFGVTLSRHLDVMKKMEVRV